MALLIWASNGMRLQQLCRYRLAGGLLAFLLSLGDFSSGPSATLLTCRQYTALVLHALTSVPSGFDRCSSSYQFEDARQRDRWAGAGIGRVCVNLRLLCLVSEELGTRGDAPEAALAILKVSSQLAAAGL